MSSTDKTQDSDLIAQNYSLQKRTLRLISLTDIIRREMESSNNITNVESAESLSLKGNLREVIQELTETYLKERRFSETFIKRQDIQQYLDNWSSLDTVQETPSLDDKKESVSIESSRSSSDDNEKDYQEMLIEVDSEDGDRRFHKIDKRLNIVEQKLNKIYKILTGGKKSRSKKKLKQKTSLLTLDEASQVSEEFEEPRNIYDEMFYEWRENTMNSGFYAKSEETLMLNKKPAGCTFVPPPSIANMFPSSEKQLNRPVFINNVWKTNLEMGV